jgi:Spy/CpxP family protein refolding chaperone
VQTATIILIKEFKMKKMTKVILGATVLPILLSSAAVMAKGGEKEGNKGARHEQCERGAEKGLMKSLNLTAEQQAKMDELRQAGRDSMKNDREARKEQMQAMHKQEQQLVMAQDFDAKAAQELATKMVNEQAEKRVEKLKKRFEMMNILTAEQKAQLSELQQKQMGSCDMDGGHHGKKNKKSETQA